MQIVFILSYKDLSTGRQEDNSFDKIEFNYLKFHKNWTLAESRKYPQICFQNIIFCH